MVRIVLPEGHEAVGKTLAALRWGAVYGIHVVKIIRGHKHINIPEGHVTLQAHDILYAIGTDLTLDAWQLGIHEKNTEDGMPTLHQFINDQDDRFAHGEQLYCYALKVTKDLALAHKSIRGAEIKSRFSCILIGMERNMLPIFNPRPDMVIRNDDVLWLLGTKKMASKLLINDVLPELMEDDEIEALMHTDK